MKASILLGFAAGISLASASPEVHVVKTPEDGIQPVAEIDEKDALHLVFFKGDPAHGDLYHAVRQKGSTTFDTPVKVNSQPESAIAIGTIRGAQLAVGRANHVHVTWMGSSRAAPDGDHHRTPMLYARSTDGGKRFEPERNLITTAYGLDGGGAVAADGAGNVSVFWHAGKPEEGEAGRKIWFTRSRDDGRTFSPELPAWDGDTGVCGCCGMTAGASGSRSWVLYRSATDRVHRDIYLLGSGSHGAEFSGRRLDRWRTDTCPMSAMSLSFAGDLTVAAWETADGGLAYQIVGSEISGRVPPGKVKRKFPDIAVAPDGHVLLAWIDGGGWNKEGHLAWQSFDPKGRPLGEPRAVESSAVWTKPAAVYQSGSFVIVH